MNNYNKNGGCDSSTRLKTSWFPHTKDYEMGQNVREQVNDIFASLKKGETFSPEMTELIKKELERVSKEAIEYNKKKREDQK